MLIYFSCHLFTLAFRCYLYHPPRYYQCRSLCRSLSFRSYYIIPFSEPRSAKIEQAVNEREINFITCFRISHISTALTLSQQPKFLFSWNSSHLKTLLQRPWQHIFRALPLSRPPGKTTTRIFRFSLESQIKFLAIPIHITRTSEKASAHAWAQHTDKSRTCPSWTSPIQNKGILQLANKRLFKDVFCICCGRIAG